MSEAVVYNGSDVRDPGLPTKHKIDIAMLNFRARQISRLIALICALAFSDCMSPASVDAKPIRVQEQTSRREAELVTQPMLDEGLKSAQDDKSLEGETLKSIEGIYDDAGRDLSEMERLAKEEARYEGMIQSAEPDLKSARKQAKSEEPLEKDVVVPADANVDQIEAELRNLKARDSKLRQEKTDLTAEPGRREARLLKLPEEVAEAEEKLKSLSEQLEVPAIAGESEVMTQARDLGLRAEGQMVQQKLATLQKEQDAYLATADLIKLKQDITTRKAKDLKKQIEKLETLVDSERQREIKSLAEETTATAEQALDKPNLKELRTYAETNVGLSKQLQETAKKVSAAQDAATAAENAQQKLESDLATAEARVDSVKLSDAMGVMLRQDRTNLNMLRKKFANTATMENTVLMRVEEYRLEDLKTEVEYPVEAAAAEIEKLKVPPERATVLKQPLIELFQSRKEMLSRLVDLQQKLITALNERAAAEQSFNVTSDEYTNFINEHILWIRSSRPIGYGDREAWAASVSWASDWKRWAAVGQALIRSVSKQLPRALPWLALVIVMVAFHFPLSRRIYSAGLQAEKRSCRNFTPTSTVLVRTFLKSLMWPSFLYVAGKLILIGTTSGPHSPFCLSVGTALIQTALILVPLELLRQTCRGKGLAEAHLELQPHSCKAMKRELDWYLPISAVLLILTLMLRNHGEESWNGTLGRATMAILLLLSTFVLYRAVRPDGLFYVRPGTGEDESQWANQLRFLRLIFLPGVPLILLIFELAGYNYTAMELGKVWLQTIAVGIVLLILYMVALRFFLVRRRRLRYEQLVEQREQARKLAEEANDGEVESAASALPIELKTETGMDITDVSRQARELTGVLFCLLAVVIFWNLWQELLPATKILDEWNLWSTTTGANGENVDYVTMRDVLISALLFVLTFLGVRNIPGLLELLLLKQLPLDAGSRYAISTIVRYIITVAGVILALSFLKVPWTKYSWLVAAISVGLGFGLQEIVANFVSGLILLLERPVRVGDVVTIDGTTGVISRIQMRATTVTNWDNQELVVPNKDLITGKLMNWTLSSVINRIAIGVGVEYGSDPERVQDILLKVAKENPDVLNDPAPTVTFEEFGDSSLNFRLRCCVTAISRRYPIIHAINTAIYKGLTEADITIPFPQRDVNLNLPEGFENSFRKSDDA